MLNAQYALRRLRHPIKGKLDIHARVLAGELLTYQEIIDHPTRVPLAVADAVSLTWIGWEPGVLQEVRGVLLAATRRQGGAAASHRRGEFHRSTRGAIRIYQGHRNGDTTAAWAYSSGDVFHPFRVRTKATTHTCSTI